LADGVVGGVSERWLSEAIPDEDLLDRWVHG
jgi:hypothetical protein